MEKKNQLRCTTNTVSFLEKHKNFKIDKSEDDFNIDID